MEEGKMPENHLTSAAAFVEGGAQEACEDACSICLEVFSDSDPLTLTTCKHEFHLQCILEWCQRSSQCPMCWQPISLKDPSSQELLDAVEHERSIRMNPPRNTAIFHHPTLGDFELQHLPVSASDSELEERIIQHLAAAAAMGRARHLARRESHRNRSSTQGRPHFLVFSTDPTGTSASASPPVTITSPSSPLTTIGEDSTSSGSTGDAYQFHTRTTPINRVPPARSSSPRNQDRAGSSDLHSFSESFKSRLSALSTRYKESITKSTKSWKDRLFTRGSSAPPTRVHRETANLTMLIPTPPGTVPITRMMDHLEIAPHGRATAASATNPSDLDTAAGAASRASIAQPPAPAPASASLGSS
ncbi:E3 ubiquitin-protein ligase RHF2A-like [Andrographis paniculata]|uniref:E3 ubiquitin-protein ligase RHF2A-like n=1 Tax=Andrographis paniculata TaxID=175694 RepID=UPI0021E89F89|nr:E3 ubiquitin-protein ligase RHF2A-like [Andrographis paniculata]XP_051120278.1 E3 ubiquitin-protein ligase RHF2A-like [Andrographis paniculata]XP_051120279.1 E3 ubiquitin-protein ligase RHF2A-like [Andrographis paniculata]